jgi:hypothetical protein
MRYTAATISSSGLGCCSSGVAELVAVEDSSINSDAISEQDHNENKSYFADVEGPSSG